jgi:hypothetical protein
VNIITIYQLDIFTPDVQFNPNKNVSFVGEYSLGCKSIGVGLYPSLMGTFPLHPLEITPTISINMISAVIGKPIGYNDPWVIPHPSDIECYGDTIALSPMDLAYSVIQSVGYSSNSHSSLLLDEELDQFFSPCWVNHNSTSHDFLKIIFPSDEDIMEVMTLQDKPWEDSHH